MNIALYFGTADPKSGGAYTLLETIKKEILGSYCEHEITIVFSCEDYPIVEDDNNVKYFNLHKKEKKENFFEKIQRKIFQKSANFEVKNLLNDFLIKNGFDLLWIIGPYLVDVNIPYVFTVWDLGHRSRPCFPELRIDGWTWEEREATYKKMLFKAVYVITGNTTGKQEILENYPMDPNKIKIIPFPIPSFCFQKENEDKLSFFTKKPFVFYPAQFWAHKNHIAVVESIKYLRDKMGVIINCYFVGSDKGNMEYINQAIIKYELSNQIEILGFVDELTLRFLYRNALAMIFLSLLGPNNLPPMEAVAMGCPVIISNIKGHVEQMQGASLEVDPFNPVEIGQAIESLATSTSLRNDLISKGYVLAQKFQDFSYFSKICEIVNEYSLYQKTWK